MDWLRHLTYPHSNGKLAHNISLKTLLKTVLVKLVRNLLLPFPATLKFTVCRSLLGEYKAGLAIDVLGATIAHRYEPAEVDGWLAELGFQHVIQTIATNEIYRKAFQYRRIGLNNGAKKITKI